MRLRILIVGLTAILLTGVGAVFGLHHGESPDPGGAQAPGSLSAGQAPADQLTASIARAQKHLSAVPGDYDAWAALGSAYPSVPASPPIPRITRRPRGRCDAHSSCGRREIRPP